MSITTATLVTTNDVEEATSDEGIIKVVAELSTEAPAHGYIRRVTFEPGGYFARNKPNKT